MSVHLQGFGFLGTYIGIRLEKEGIPFTWSDTDAAVTAWRACTGAIYPSGHALDMECYDRWSGRSPSDVFAVADYWYSTKGAPHEGRWPARRDIGSMRLHALPSYHVNAQRWVEQARRRYAELRTERKPTSSTLVVAHGFGQRLDHVVWGWTRHVRLRFDRAVFGPSPAFYCREGRFTMAYAYPTPGESGVWYAGSSLIVQRTPKQLEIAPKYARWETTFKRLTAGLVEVEPVGQFMQGWRPAGRPEDERMVVRTAEGWAIRPLWHSGVRWAPAIADAVVQALR